MNPSSHPQPGEAAGQQPSGNRYTNIHDQHQQLLQDQTAQRAPAHHLADPLRSPQQNNSNTNNSDDSEIDNFHSQNVDTTSQGQLPVQRVYNGRHTLGQYLAGSPILHRPPYPDPTQYQIHLTGHYYVPVAPSTPGRNPWAGFPTDHRSWQTGGEPMPSLPTTTSRLSESYQLRSTTNDAELAEETPEFVYVPHTNHRNLPPLERIQLSRASDRASQPSTAEQHSPADGPSRAPSTAKAPVSRRRKSTASPDTTLIDNRDSGASAAGAEEKKTIERVPVWPQYSLPKEPLPAGLTLYDIAKRYPNHLSGEVLELFIRARWSANEIMAAMPDDCRAFLLNRGGKYHDPAMWLQKRLQKREAIIQKVGVDGMKQFWESPQTLADGRTGRATMRASGKPPNAEWIKRWRVTYIGPDKPNVKLAQVEVLREPSDASFFRVPDDWKSPIEESKNKGAVKRPKSTGNTRATKTEATRAKRRRTAPADLTHPVKDTDSDAAGEADDEIVPPAKKQKVLAARGDRRVSRKETPEEDEEYEEEEEEEEEGEYDEESESEYGGRKGTTRAGQKRKL